MNCRHCGTPLELTMLDLGAAPPSNAYLNVGDLTRAEVYYPLRIKVCRACWLVQTEDYAHPNDLFGPEYAYFSSTSSAWLDHAARYSEKVIKRFRLSSESFVIEVASNDGYLLKNFVAAGIPCLGIEPTASTATAAEKLGIEVLREFFGEQLAGRLSTEGRQADLIIGNNVYAHVPDINDFTRGLKRALKPGGIITLEFPHLMRLLEHNQFDTVYHEHYSYLSLYTVCRIFESVGLRVWDVEELPTHGGSLRVYGCHAEDDFPTNSVVRELLESEKTFGMREAAVYESFQSRADRVKNDLLMFLLNQKANNNKVAAYGAAAKGNTLLNYAGVKPDLLPFVCDAAPSKQNKYMPGSRIPILHPEVLQKRQLDYLLVLPWNILPEIQQQNAFLRAHGTRFVSAVPELRIL